MSEIIIRRSDIWMANLSGDEGNVLKGIHPVLIISCKKSNNSTTLVNVCPVTSTLKSNITNIPIGAESGLLHESVVLCGQVQTISKKDLFKKVGFAKRQLMDLVIRTIVKQIEGKNNELSITQKEKLDYMLKSIKKLISFKIKYNIIDVEIDEQIENSFLEIKDYCNSINIDYNGLGNLEIFKIHQKSREKIRVTQFKKDYITAVKLSEEYLKSLYEIDYTVYGNEICSELEWALYNLSLAVKKLGEIERSYKLAKQALTFSTEENSNRILTYWLIGECCNLMGSEYKEEGINVFEKCISFYKSVGEKKYEILLQFNKAKILKDITSMEELIKEYEMTQFKNVLHTFGDMENDEVLKELKIELNNTF